MLNKDHIDLTNPQDAEVHTSYIFFIFVFSVKQNFTKKYKKKNINKIKFMIKDVNKYIEEKRLTIRKRCNDFEEGTGKDFFFSRSLEKFECHLV